MGRRAPQAYLNIITVWSLFDATVFQEHVPLAKKLELLDVLKKAYQVDKSSLTEIATIEEGLFLLAVPLIELNDLKG